MFKKNQKYTRAQIAVGLSVGDSEATRAVLVLGGHAVAIVVNAPGIHPTQAAFFNDLTATEFRMEGTNDDRGALIERSGKFPLFIAHTLGDSYTFEGHIEYVDKTDLAGRPLRRYKRV